MPGKKKVRIVNLYIKPGTFAYIFRRLAGQKQEYDFSDLSDLRKILSNEKARIMNIIKMKKPNSIYHLAKLLGRDFKSVIQDVKVLERFGLLELKLSSKGKRKVLVPKVAIDTLQINISFE